MGGPCVLVFSVRCGPLRRCRRWSCLTLKNWCRPILHRQKRGGWVSWMKTTKLWSYSTPAPLSDLQWSETTLLDTMTSLILDFTVWIECRWSFGGVISFLYISSTSDRYKSQKHLYTLYKLYTCDVIDWVMCNLHLICMFREDRNKQMVCTLYAV